MKNPTWYERFTFFLDESEIAKVPKCIMCIKTLLSLKQKISYMEKSSIFDLLSPDTMWHPAACAKAWSQSAWVCWCLGHTLATHYSLKVAVSTRTSRGKIDPTCAVRVVERVSLWAISSNFFKGNIPQASIPQHHPMLYRFLFSLGVCQSLMFSYLKANFRFGTTG